MQALCRWSFLVHCHKCSASAQVQYKHVYWAPTMRKAFLRNSSPKPRRQAQGTCHPPHSSLAVPTPHHVPRAKGSLQSGKVLTGCDVASCPQPLVRVSVRNSHVVNTVVKCGAFRRVAAVSETICHAFLSGLRRRLSVVTCLPSCRHLGCVPGDSDSIRAGRAGALPPSLGEARPGSGTSRGSRERAWHQEAEMGAQLRLAAINGMVVSSQHVYVES